MFKEIVINRRHAITDRMKQIQEICKQYFDEENNGCERCPFSEVIENESFCVICSISPSEWNIDIIDDIIIDYNLIQN